MNRLILTAALLVTGCAQTFASAPNPQGAEELAKQADKELRRLDQLQHAGKTRTDGPISQPYEAPGADPQIRESMNRAIKALRRLAAATEAGLNYREYGTRLVDAKMEVEDAIGDLRGELPTEFQNEIESIFQVYKDASDWWHWKIIRAGYHKCSGTECLYDSDDPLIWDLMSRYPSFHSIIIQEASGGIFLPEGRLNHSAGLSLLWSHAHEKTDKLHASLPPIPSAPAQSAKERLQELQSLLSQSLITQEEYERKRAEILNEL